MPSSKIQFKLSALAIFMSVNFHSVNAQETIQTKKMERIEVQTKRSSVLTQITDDAQKLTSMPGAMGDPLLAVYALPGVVAAGGSMSEPAVRGSAPSDNLFEVDFMPAGYIFHDFGSSIFNKYIIQDFQLYSASYGTSYSNATGAVFDVSLRNPKYQPLKTTLDFTMFNAGIFTEGQLTENTAFYFSARKSTLPLFFEEGEELEDDDGELTGVTVNQAPDDHDYQGKLIWDMNHNNMFTFSFTGAEDSAKANFNQRAELALKNPEYQGDATFSRGFNSQNILWDHYGDGFHLKMGIGSLNETGKFEYGRGQTDGGFYENETEKQITYKARVNYQVNQEHSLVFDAAYHDKEIEFSYDMFQYTCTDIDPDCTLNKGGRVQDKRTEDIDDQFVGISHIWQATDKIQSEFGAQWQHNDYSDETFVHPRVALSYFATDESTINFKYGEYNRLQDLDTIVPEIGNPNLKSQTAKHTSLGFQQELADEWSWSIEGYYKAMSDLPLALTQSYADSELLYSNDVEGQAYGFDFLINKNKTDKWYGWMSLSYAKSERTDLRRDITRDYYTDTPLVMNVVFNYQINERWNGGFNFTARSGQAYTPITGVTNNPDHEGKFLPQYGEPFSERFDVAHRLDVRFERKTDFFDLDAMLIFEVMNVYGQDNVSYIDLDYQKIQSTNDLIIKEETDDFEMRPSIGFSVSF